MLVNLKWVQMSHDTSEMQVQHLESSEGGLPPMFPSSLAEIS